MKIVITLEDTRDGIAMFTRAAHNGFNDATEASIAFLIAVNIGKRIEEMKSTGILVLTDDNNVTH